MPARQISTAYSTTSVESTPTLVPATNPEQNTPKNTTSISSEKRKKKKKKSKAKGGAKGEDASANAKGGHGDGKVDSNEKPNVLYIARNKHWKYISSYHGPWLQLPIELLESLLQLNLEQSTIENDFEVTAGPTYALPAPDTRSISAPPSPNHAPRGLGFERLRELNAPSLGFGKGSSNSRLASPLSPDERDDFHDPPPPTSMTGRSGTSDRERDLTQLNLPPGKAAPPPIDPGVFKSVVGIRRLVDESADLAVRASSGLSAAALGALQSGGGGGGGGGWNGAQSMMGGGGYGYGGMGGGGDMFGGGAGGRNVPMSATRVHRLRAMAVQRLSDAYKADEIAASVMVMQRGSVFDDIAERVLKNDPKNVNARYVHFFHEKIPSRQLPEFTTTAVLDQLIAENPQDLHFYRTRGIIHGFRDEFSSAIRDYTYVIKESRALRRSHEAHLAAAKNESTHSKSRRKKSSKVHGQAPPNGISVPVEVNGPDGRKMTIDPQSSKLGNDADPLEVQALFYRGSTYLAQAFHLIEGAICEVEDIPRIAPNDFGEIQLAHIVGKYGGTEMENPNGPLGKSTEEKARAYADALAEESFKEQVISLLKKSRRDHERFLSHFATLNTLPLDSENGAYISEPEEDGSRNVLERMENSFLLLETLRPSARQHEPPSSGSSNSAQKDYLSDTPLPFTTYHPLMLESHFSVLNCLLLLGDFEALVPAFERTARVVAGLEGYPVFLPPRSMAQAEFVEVLERLASGWKYGKMENALVPAGTSSVNSPQISLREREKSRAAELGTTSIPSFGLGQSSREASLPPSRPRLEHMASSSSTIAGPSGSGSRRVYLSQPFASGSGSPVLSSPQLDASELEQLDSTATPTPTPRDFRPALEHLRYLLAPIHSRLATSSNKTPLSDPPAPSRARTGGEAGKGKGGSGKAPLNLVLHGARVEVILAWIGAVFLPDLEAAASEI